MKRVFVLALVAALVVGISAWAQDTASQGTAPAASAEKAPLKTIKGTVKAEGDKVMFVSDKDQKSWDVANPETLKDHDGHHVAVKAHVYADKNQIHVMDVKMLKEKGEKASMNK
jgi:hypothetical protein